MKRLLIPFLTSLLLSTPALSQGLCDSVSKAGRSFLSIPSFFSLYFNGNCIEKNMGDTTICVKFPPSAVGRIAAFSYSSPSGQPAFVTGYSQYDGQCTFISNTPQIYPSADTITLCYTIDAALIDNFCPYAITMPGLAVEFCGISASVQGAYVTVSFETCSNSGTHYFEILESSDMVNWVAVTRIEPWYITTSDRMYYSWTGALSQGGIRYLCVRETDYNGKHKDSEPVFVEVPYPSIAPGRGSFDILGRAVQSPQYRYIVQPNR